MRGVCDVCALSFKKCLIVDDERLIWQTWGHLLYSKEPILSLDTEGGVQLKRNVCPKEHL
jgi:hypothetical protein